MPCCRVILPILLAVHVPFVRAATDIPPVEGETLAGRHIRLPSDLAQPTVILIVGFTQKSGGQAENWGKEVAKFRACGQEQPIEWYEMPVLSGVPRLIRPLVVRSIRSGLGLELRTHFVPVYSEEASWKAAMGFSVPDDAYIAIVSRDGKIGFRLHGAFDSDKAAQLRDRLQAACPQ